MKLLSNRIDGSALDGSALLRIVLAVQVTVSMIVLFSGCKSEPTTARKSGEWRSVAGSDQLVSAVSLQYDQSHNVLYAIGLTPGTNPSKLPASAGVWRCIKPDTEPLWKFISEPTIPSIIGPLALDPSRTSLYSASGDSFGSKGIWRCLNPEGAYIWTNTGWVRESNYTITCLAYDSVHEILYAGTNSAVVLRCSDLESAPSSTSIGGAVLGVSSLLYDPTNDVLYAGTDTTGIWRCRHPDIGGTWESINDGLEVDRIMSICIDDTGGNLFAGTQGNGVWHCTSPIGNASWRKVTGEIESLAVTAIICDSDDDCVYATAYDVMKMQGQGVWRYGYGRQPKGWRRVDDSQAPLTMHSLVMDSRRGILYGGTSGAGVWSCSLWGR